MHALNGSTVRTPEQHRTAVSLWQMSAPANDSDVLPRDRSGVGKPEFEPLLPALRTWRELSSPSEPLTTNWLIGAGNDNVADEPFDPYEDEWKDAPPPPSIDSEMEVRPRPDEMMRSIGDVEIAYGESDKCHAVAVGGDMDVHPGSDPVIIGGMPCAPLARLGMLRFGNGKTVERVLLRTEGNVIKKGDRRIPRGALTHCGPFPVRDRHASWRGAISEKMDPRSTGPSTSMDDRIDAERLAGRLRQQLSADDVAVLDAALEAANFEDIGRLFGRRGKAAERLGKSLLLDAAVRLGELLQAS